MPSFDRFNKRWASSGQTETITDNNADLGLAFIGDDPPTVELHNKMFQQLDDKDNILFNWINEVYKERTGIPAGITAETPTLLRDAIAVAASSTKTGLQRNGTAPEVAGLALDNVTVTPATLKPLLDAIGVAITNAVPTAAVMAFSRSTAPTGWLVCDGSAVSRATYLQLFSVIGTTYGAGDGSTTFNLPDARHKVIRGWPNQTTGPDANRVLGSTQTPSNNAHTHTITLAAVADHVHSFSTQTAGGHTHTGTVAASGAHDHAITVVANGAHTHTITVPAAGDHSHGGFTDDSGTHTHPVSVDVAGSRNQQSMVHSNNSDEGIVTSDALIGQSGNHSHNVTTSAAGYHTHAATASTFAAHTHTATSATEPDHTHTVTIAAVAAHSHTGTTDTAGGFTPTGTAASEGGETRMLNISLLYCIKT